MGDRKDSGGQEAERGSEAPSKTGGQTAAEHPGDLAERRLRGWSEGRLLTSVWPLPY